MRRVVGWTLLMALLGWTQAFAATATATIHGTTEGSPITGTVDASETPQGLALTITVEHVSPGQHGLHIHELGDCGDAGKAAGGHYNPDSTKHGYLPKDGFTGAHAGDLGNIEVRADGTGTLSLTVPGLTVADGLHAIAGHAVILHEKADDFGQPTGNAGGRIGCGILEASAP